MRDGSSWKKFVRGGPVERLMGGGFLKAFGQSKLVCIMVDLGQCFASCQPQSNEV